MKEKKQRKYKQKKDKSERHRKVMGEKYKYSFDCFSCHRPFDLQANSDVEGNKLPTRRRDPPLLKSCPHCENPTAFVFGVHPDPKENQAYHGIPIFTPNVVAFGNCSMGSKSFSKYAPVKRFEKRMDELNRLSQNNVYVKQPPFSAFGKCNATFLLV